MKRMVWISILMMLIVVLVPVNGICQEEEPEEEEPVQARPNPMAWVTLKNDASLRNMGIKAVQNNRALSFNLAVVKQALQKAKVNQKVTIQYLDAKGNLFQLGTYAPSFRSMKKKATKRKATKKKTSHLARRAINPQPEPPMFRTIPLNKQIAISAAVKSNPSSLKQTGKNVLLFKNAKGQIKAIIQLKSSPLLRKRPSEKKSLR
jgi:hypothetical protein